MSGCPVLVERDDELRLLTRLGGEAAAAGEPRIAVLTGEAGGGKSRLARELAASLPEVWTAHAVVLSRSGATLPAAPAERPLLLVVDDAHFLDPAELAEVADALRGAVLAVLGFRLAGQSAELRALGALVRDPRVTELRLAPLSPDGVERMAAAMGHYAPEDLYGRTQGNPFWTEEVLRCRERLPWTVLEAVALQLEALPAAARELARVLALAEEPVPAGAAARLATDRAWAVLAGSGLGREAGDGLGLRHALVGEAIQVRIGPGERAALHARLAGALEPEGAEADRVARHWAAAGQTERAAALARSAAGELRARGASRRAFECFRLAVRHAPDAALYEAAAQAAAAVGEHDVMREWLAAAERLYRADGRPDRTARMLLDPAFDYAPVRRSLAVRDEPVERLLAGAQAAMAAGRPGEADGLVNAAIDGARERGDGMALARAARMACSMLGEFARGEALLDEAEALLDLTAHPSRASRLLTIRAVTRIARGEDALDLLRAAVAVSGEDLWTGGIALGDALLRAGRLDEGAATIADALGALPWASALAAMVDAYRRFERGEPALDDLVRAGDRTLAELDMDPLGRAVIASHALHICAQAEVHGGRPEAALRTVRRLAALAPEPFNEVAADLAYVEARAGAPDAAGERIAELGRVAGGPGVVGVAEAVRGFAAEREEACRRFQSAAALLERAPRAVPAAELWCDAARAAGPGRLATAALARAQRLCDEYGLRRVAVRVAAERGQLAAAPARLPAALAELTSREREVVLLAAEGLSNREIGARLYLSEGTVRNYLSTAYGKVGVSRRAELGRLVATG